ncbi:hypothetical protein BO71DRAFT_487358 [Aspergillus ellipticus CBS 707.79]|uniref:Zn(2)-C6 fungal-type domain-containing protein n=1 Tax=Aspergillus ellipticus CBS 707.79 TaxID=1448320 RepID=A0A319D6J8_9EURO|nr:hypothetical protein BO71DRAFT_487358 [Aspergillus ellipticus CBS 707.79]
MPGRRDPCQHCRKHHLRCDDTRPKCGRCNKAGRDCVRLQPQVQFIHSTSAEFESRGRTSQSPSGIQIERRAADADSPNNPSLEYVDESPAVAALYRPEPDPSLPLSTNAFASPVNPSPTSTETPVEATHLPAKLPQAQLSLEEACLLRYFFDLCDPNRHFTLIVPQRARTCPPFLDALLSVAARHFSTLPPSDQIAITQRYGLPTGLTISEQSTLLYHSRCITHLRSVSDDPRTLMDENLLAAVVTLRFYEELDTPFPPPFTAIRGLQVFLHAQAPAALTPTEPFRTLRRATFWIGIRQEFHLCFLHHRPFQPALLALLAAHTPPYPPPAAQNHHWAHSLLVLGAQIIQFCFGDGATDARVGVYDELVQRRDGWVRACPDTFSPVVVSERDPANGVWLPMRWFLDECHVFAAQSLGFCWMCIILVCIILVRGRGRRWG